MNKISLAALLAALLTTSVSAADMYIGLKVGKVKHTISGVASTPTDIGVLGGYMISPELAVEIEYIDLGNYGASRANATDVSLLYFYPEDEPFSLYAKLSYAASEWRTQGRSEYFSGFTHGLGIQYNESPVLSYRFGLDRHMLGNQAVNNIDALSVTGIFRF